MKIDFTSLKHHTYQIIRHIVTARSCNDNLNLDVILLKYQEMKHVMQCITTYYYDTINMSINRLNKQIRGRLL